MDVKLNGKQIVYSLIAGFIFGGFWLNLRSTYMFSFDLIFVIVGIIFSIGVYALVKAIGAEK